MADLERVQTAAGVTLFDHQVDALGTAIGQPGRERLCLYHRTGAGKTITSLLAVHQWGRDEALVIAPPSTHPAWVATGAQVGVEVTAMSHAKFRMKGTWVRRKIAVIADEMHMFGGHRGQGWLKLEGLAKGLDAPLVMASATPNYNDAERVYCIQRILDPHSCKGGFLEFVYRHCTTKQNPFGMEPIVTGFHHFKDAEAYLAALPGVAYLPDELVWSIVDVPFSKPAPQAYEVFGYDERRHRIVASIMEDRHRRIQMALIDDQGLLDYEAYEEIEKIRKTGEPVLIYANHATVAEALAKRFTVEGVGGVLLVTGDTSKKVKAAAIQQFIDGDASIMVGTASLATGTDGLDKVCDKLIILDDTDDDSLRRQLVGRIMPRGADSDASMKQVYRLLQQ